MVPVVFADMSGIEVVGILLAVMPLLISAAEHYRDLATPFTRYRGFTGEARMFLAELQTQQTIFRNEARLLLGSVVGHAQAVNMIMDPADEAWNDKTISEAIDKHLGDCRAACVTTLSSIDDTLVQISALEKRFAEVLEHDQMVSIDMTLYVILTFFGTLSLGPCFKSPAPSFCKHLLKWKEEMCYLDGPMGAWYDVSSENSYFCDHI